MATMLRRLSAVCAGLACAAAFAAAFAAVDINTANRAQLEAIRGVGTQLAERILAARTQGAFRDWADLIARVPGVGAASAARLSDGGLTIGGLPYGGERR
jgi:competence protein ComEA